MKINTKLNSFYLSLIDEAYFRQAWHGPNMKSALKGVTAEDALKRPAEGRHNIYEIVVHSAYWLRSVINRIKRDKSVEFPHKGSNWFESPVSLNEKEWQKEKKLLKDLHEKLYNLIKNLNEGDFEKPGENSKQIAGKLITGIAMHDIYHVGQIQLIKKII